MPVTIRLTNNFPRIAAQLEPLAIEVVAKTAFDIEADAKGTVPVDTGNLKGSIVTQTDGLQASVGTSVDYSIYVEMGTRFMGAQPFMTPAAERARPAFVESMRRALGGLR